MPDVDRINRTSSEDGGDQIGYDAPQSGAATPQPDLRDKRLPGIMSYFSQVRRDAPTPHAAETTSPSYFALKTPPAAYAEPFNWPTRRHMASRSADLQATAAPPTTTITNAIPTMMRAAPSSRPSSRPPSRPLSRAPSGANLNLNLNLNLAMTSGPAEEGSSDHLQAGQTSSSGRDPGLVRHSYFLTPPTSLPSSSVSSPVQERRNPFWSVGPAGAALRDTDIMPPPPVSSCSTPGLEKSSREDPIITTTPPDAHDGGDDGRLAGWNPWQGSKSKSMPNSTRNSTSAFRPQTPQPGKTEASGRWYTLEGLRELTRGLIKSGPPTPTRALSTAQPSPHAENHDLLGAGKGQGRSGSRSVSNDDGAEPSGTQTPRGGVIGTGPTAATSSASTGAQAPAPKGKLTIKIPEARGLRKSRDPYLIVVFQRSELISASPRSMDGGETLSPAPPTLGGGVPIQRQGSDNGPPPMSIPMRSRQSSNTSVTDHSNVRRPSRVSFTNPKWDAEAVL
ncbi:hypothetical protein GMORB2_5733 [Geosmithia morbida]|uniref:Uncharacterized protein n=1 Tax=Geosmithia morbida TaxID=1094350 RepID=A0A9P4YWV4_9HYPO|nr:uncharacterized protein GMORB2_5733 [Geosmithia morbida]KAF4124017.1 hypothetical protein GMORB2_5733 [Geosmithia morbida]